MDLKDCAAVLGACVAALALIKASIEYVRQGTQKRVELFLELDRRFCENESFRRLVDLAETDDPSLVTENRSNKYDLLGFFEQVALLVNSGLMDRAVAHYMFGFYVVQVYNSNNFWTVQEDDGGTWKIDKQSHYWKLYVSFAEDMSAEEDPKRMAALNPRELSFGSWRVSRRKRPAQV